GELAVRTHDPSSDVLAEAPRLWLVTKAGEGRELAILSRRQAAREWLLTLPGVTNREAAEAWKGASVSVFRSDIAPPKEAEGEFFQGDLVGLQVVDPQGRPLGRVESLWNTGPVPNVVVRLADGGELVVPFADEFVPSVDVAKGEMVVRPPEVVE